LIFIIDRQAWLSLTRGVCATISIRFVALADIRAGDELSLSYIDASKPTEQRRLALSSIYFFHCMCARCENGTTSSSSGGNRGKSKNGRAKTKDDYVQRFVCSSCTKHNGRGVMYVMRAFSLARSLALSGSRVSVF
jgi:hypothetical protein